MFFPLFSSHKSVYGQGQIPEDNCQLPDQNYAADQTTEDKVECDNTYCPGNAKTNRNQREHLPNAKRHSASKPDQEIIGRSVFDENTAEHRKQKQCNHNRNDGLLYKKLPLFHLYDSDLTGTQKLLMTLLLVNQFDIYDLSCLARMRPEDVAADLAELKRKGYLQGR